MHEPRYTRWRIRHLHSGCQRRTIAGIGAIIFLAIATPGCKQGTKALSVRGRVTYQSAPLKSGSATFYPTSGRAVTAAISNGDYSTELVPGDYTVGIMVSPELPAGYKEGDPPPPPPKIVLPDKYTVRAKSILKTSIRQGPSEPIDFDLK
jgi:hypothetical protein